MQKEFDVSWYIGILYGFPVMVVGLNLKPELYGSIQENGLNGINLVQISHTIK